MRRDSPSAAVNITRRFSATVLDHFDHPRHAGEIPAPDGSGTAEHSRSRIVTQMQVQLSDDRIVDAGFKTFGCVPAIACASFVADWAVGRTLKDIAGLSPEQVIAGLDGVPADRRFCAGLAVDALKAAIEDATANRKDTRTCPT